MKTHRPHVLVLVVAIVPCSTTAAAPVEWPLEDGGNGHFYEAVHVGSFTTWEQARDLAEASGGHLATITSAAENAFVFSLIENRPDLWTLSTIDNGLGPWIGGFQDPLGTEPDEGWSWVTGEDWDYTNWSGGEPSEGVGGNADYLHFFGAGSPTGNTWNDAFGDGLWDIRGYVAEYVPSPSTAGLIGSAVFIARRRRDRATVIDNTDVP